MPVRRKSYMFGGRGAGREGDVLVGGRGTGQEGEVNVGREPYNSGERGTCNHFVL